MAAKYTTAAQETAEQNRLAAQKARKFVYDPNLFDRINSCGLEPGAIVVKQQPFGAPRNGTMGMCYVADSQTGKFIGMVCVNSLKPVKAR